MSSERGQVTILGVGFALACIALAMVLAAVGKTYVAHAELQQAADVAAASLGRPSGDDPASRARQLARDNGATSMSIELDGSSQVVVVRAPAPDVAGMALPGGKLVARANVERPLGPVVPAGSASGSHGDYSGPLVAVDGARVCPAVASDYRAMQRSAGAAGVRLYATSGYRSYAEQAVLYGQLGPTLAAPPGTSLHHAATELDINVGPAGSTTHSWLTRNAGRFNFLQRYSWEPWHWGNLRGC